MEPTFDRGFQGIPGHSRVGGDVMFTNQKVDYCEHLGADVLRSALHPPNAEKKFYEQKYIDLRLFFIIPAQEKTNPGAISARQICT